MNNQSDMAQSTEPPAVETIQPAAEVEKSSFVPLLNCLRKPATQACASILTMVVASRCLRARRVWTDNYGKIELCVKKYLRDGDI